ncbi:MAG TPA: hypothetical protein VFU97_18215 [Xanthobacteraceae bacterium]|nr:hypothetical protein [Xanthobacteraceae bacterium]
MSERADMIQRRILQIEDRLHQLTVRLKELETTPDHGRRLLGALRELSRRPVEDERNALIEQRSKLEREYDRLPEPLKS